MHTGAGGNRSGRFATPCSGCVEQLCHVRDGMLRQYHPSGRNGAAALMGRSGDTTISGWLTTCTRVQVATARDALRYHAMGVQVEHGQDQAGLPTIGTFRRYHPYGRYAVDDLGTLRRYGGSCVWKAPYKSERSGRNAIPCSGWARSFTGGAAALPTVATPQRYHRLDRCWFEDSDHNARVGHCTGGTLRRYHGLWAGCGFPTSAS